MREGWKQIRLGDVFEPRNDRLGDVEAEPTVFAISKYEGVIPSESYHSRRVASADLSKYKILRPNDWAYSTIHIDEGSIGRSRFEEAGVLSPMYTTLSWTSIEHDPDYFELLLRSPEMLRQYSEMAQGSINRRRSLPWKTFSDIHIHVPSSDEQRRIVDLLSAVDSTIDSARDAGLKAKKLSNHTVTAAFSGMGLEPFRIGELLEQVRRPVDVQPSATYTEVGIRSHGRGAFVKEAVQGTSLGRKKVFWLTPGLLALNIVFAWEGAVTILGPEVDGKIASHRFPTFKSRIPLAVEVLDQYFKTAMGRSLLVDLSPGGAGRNKTLNQSALLASTIQLPVPSSWPALVAGLHDAEALSLGCAELVERSMALRSELLTSLLSGEHEIPPSYDEAMDRVPKGAPL